MQLYNGLSKNFICIQSIFHAEGKCYRCLQEKPYIEGGNKPVLIGYSTPSIKTIIISKYWVITVSI